MKHIYVWIQLWVEVKREYIYKFGNISDDVKPSLICFLKLHVFDVI